MRTFGFILVMVFWAFSFALPFQDPVPGSYTCFASQESAFDKNAHDAGATFAINTDGSYTLTTVNASENGSVQTQEITEEGLELVFQRGSSISLHPSSGSPPYPGMFTVDKQGGMYVFIQNNNGVWIRCESQGADIAAAFETVKGEDLETETTPEPTMPTATTSSETLQPLQAVQSGSYNCYHTYETTSYYDDGSVMYYNEGDPVYFASLFFDDGTMLTMEANDTYNSEFEEGSYTFDAAQSNISIEGGNLGGLTLSYGKNANGVATLSYIRTELEEDGDEWVWTYSCEFAEAVPPGISAASFENGTPVVELGNIKVAASKYDANNPDPDTIPMVDTYYCYPDFNALEVGEGFPNYRREYALEILSNNRYSFEGQEGEFSTGVDGSYLQWISGPLNPTGDVIKDEDDVILPHSSYVNYDVWGSEIVGIDIPKDDREISVDCFQQGAREQKALLDFALEQPTPGSYSCLTSGDNPQQLKLELLPDNRYNFEGQEGSYRVSVGEYSSDILWSSGPLGGDTSYTPDDETGVRTIMFSSTETFGAIIPTGSSTETTMVCQSVAPTNLIPKYSDAPAPPPPALSGGLDAFYARADYDTGDLINGEPPVTTWYYYHFLPDGHVYEDGYATGEECGKTYPNGRPVCGTYTAQGNAITFGDGRKLALLPADSGNGDVIIDGQLFENKKLEGSHTLDSTYEYVLAIAAPMYMSIAGMGTNSVSTSTYTFASDGTYSYTSDRWSQTSAPAYGGTPMGTIGALASSSSSDGDSGSYTISGNVITFNSNKGYSKQCGFFFPKNGDTTSVNICGTDYDPPSTE